MIKPANQQVASRFSALYQAILSLLHIRVTSPRSAPAAVARTGGSRLFVTLKTIWIAVVICSLTSVASAQQRTPLPPVVELLDFTADWCPPCQQMAPVIERLKKAGVSVSVIDCTSQPPPSVSYYNVDRLPTYILLQRGKEMRRWVGVVAYDELIGETQKYQPRQSAIPAKPASASVLAPGDQVPTMDRSPVVFLCRKETSEEHIHCTGFVVAHIPQRGGEALVVANSHFIRDDPRNLQSTAKRTGVSVVWPGSDKVVWPARVVAENPKNDLCVLSFVPDRSIPVAQLADRWPAKGHTAQIMGIPHTIDPRSGVGISRVFRSLGQVRDPETNADIGWFDMAPRDQESGSPIYDENSKVAGVVSARAKNEERGVAIPIQAVRQLLEESAAAMMTEHPALAYFWNGR